MSSLSLFAYPWEIAAQGVQPFVREVASLGVARVCVATTYHSAETVVPRSRSGVVRTVEANRAHLALPDGTFTDLGLAPSRLATEQPGFFEELARACTSAGLVLDAWVIAFHNSDMAQQHPEVAMVNCFGDAFTHGPCPANPRSQLFVRELTQAVQATGHFDRVFVESMAYLPYGHGHPHELRIVRLDPTTRYLLSLCFCPSCVARAEQSGIDSAGLRDWTAGELRRTWNASSSPRRADDDGKELASLLLQRPDLYAFTRMRMGVVDELTESVASALHESNGKLDLCSAVFFEPTALNFLEGIDVSQALRIADRLVVCAYYDDAAAVARDVDHALALGPADKLAVALELEPSRHGSLAGLLDKVDLIADAGVPTISLYNHSTASDAVLPWIAAVADRLRTR